MNETRDAGEEIPPLPPTPELERMRAALCSQLAAEASWPTVDAMILAMGVELGYLHHGTVMGPVEVYRPLLEEAARETASRILEARGRGNVIGTAAAQIILRQVCPDRLKLLLFGPDR